MPGVGYLGGTRLLNGLSMAGRAAGVLSVLGGGVQMVDGIVRGDAYAATDGGVTRSAGRRKLRSRRGA